MKFRVPRLASTQEQLDFVVEGLATYLRLPFAEDQIPGALVEHLVARSRGGERLATYDFVDVVNKRDRLGWQVKSTKAQTPVTWKRAKLPDQARLIAESENGRGGLAALGRAIITFCNEHAIESMHRYGLDAIGYLRVIRDAGEVIVFERELISHENPLLFNPDEFAWEWSRPKTTRTKEQLPALHGLHLPSKDRWFAWHGRGENQLHFSGERAWWPGVDSPHRVSRMLPEVNDRISWAILNEWMGRA